MKLKNETMITANRLSQEGKFVQRYNISKATIEHYFIPAANITAYDTAKYKQDLSAIKIYGTPTEHFSLI